MLFGNVFVFPLSLLAASQGTRLESQCFLVPFWQPLPWCLWAGMERRVHEQTEKTETTEKWGPKFRPGGWHWKQDLSPQGEAWEMMRRGKEFKLTYSHSGIWELSKNFWWTNSSVCHWWMKALNLHWGSPDMVLKQCRLRKINCTWTKKWRGHSGY